MPKSNNHPDHRECYSWAEKAVVPCTNPVFRRKIPSAGCQGCTTYEPPLKYGYAVSPIGVRQLVTISDHSSDKQK